ncbi:hypothetical protein LV79_002687 [Actinokineospora globicatena]|nr:hypothetical protein [Actinokineospora globicatena]GLW79911.1 hypothetical protein Aglo01_43920 [Actinokineospora globicatena]GLW85679.1 hypothetical protein Aglo02_33190 [Actinokineospora globicatena]
MGVGIGARGLAAVPGGWVALVGGELVEFGDGWQRARGRVEVSAGHPRESVGVHASASGRFVAVVVDHGETGVVVELATGAVTLELDRGDYCPGPTLFPVAFVGADLVVAATAWNRLDLFDVASGELLSAREVDEELDFFHGSIHPSPSGRWLLVDGWMWQPVGVQVAIDLAAWQAGEPAAEAAREVGPFPLDWNRPTTWLDDDTIAVQAEGTVALVDIPSGETTARIAAPDGRLWSHEGLLYIAAADGLEVWSPTEHLHRVDGFHPIAQNPATGALADARLRTWLPENRHHDSVLGQAGGDL